MKLIHLSDLHIGKQLKGFSLIEDQKYILDKILEIIRSQKADGVMIAGDIYDKSSPSAEAVTVFDSFLTDLKEIDIPVFIVSGNHDSGERLSFGAKIMEKENFFFSGVYNGTLKKVTLNDEYGEINIFLCPFVRPSDVRPFFQNEKIESYDDAVKTIINHTEINTKKRNVIIAHQFVTGAKLCDSEETYVGTLDNISSSIFEKFDYVALGHIHGPQDIVKNKIRYCGTPLKYSFSEVNHHKSVTVVNLSEKGNVSTEFIPLEPLHNMVEIKGKYDEITSLDFYSKKNREDYYHFTLTDDNEIPFVLEYLRSIYPNIMTVDYDNIRTKAISEIKTDEEIESKTPIEIIEQFFKIQSGKEMNENQKKYILNLLDEIEGAEQ